MSSHTFLPFTAGDPWTRCDLPSIEREIGLWIERQSKKAGTREIARDNVLVREREYSHRLYSLLGSLIFQP